MNIGIKTPNWLWTTAGQKHGAQGEPDENARRTDEGTVLQCAAVAHRQVVGQASLEAGGGRCARRRGEKVGGTQQGGRAAGGRGWLWWVGVRRGR